MAHVYETFTVGISRDYASEHMGGARIIGQHDLDTALNTTTERGAELHAVAAGPDYVLVVLRRGDADSVGDD